MLRLALALALLAPWVRPLPRWAGPTTWPLDRIQENLERRLKEDERDASAHYSLGRAYAFALAQERTSLQVFIDFPVRVAGHQYDRDSEIWNPTPPPTHEQELEFLTEGIGHLRRAIELVEAPEHHLTLAWLLESGADLAAQVDTVKLLGVKSTASAEELATIAKHVGDLGSGKPDLESAARRALEEKLELALPVLQALSNPGEPRQQAHCAQLLERAWVEQAIRESWLAFERAAAIEEKQAQIVDSDDPRHERVVPEALESYRRMVLARGAHADEAERLKEAERRLQELNKKLQPAFITPLLLSLREGCPSLDELTLPNLTVPFDLDGDAIDELWPWLAPDAGWLVWDPEQRGEITSGLQLFGSASAWLFFADGYRVLDALDDDRDGELRDAELAGIAVWFDRDTDGVSDPGEVVPVEELGLVALATEATERIGPSLGNPAGAELASGRRLATYDWVLSPAQPSVQQ